VIIVFVGTRDSCRSIAAFRVTFLAALETTMLSKRFPHNSVLKELIGYTGPSRHCESLFVVCYKQPQSG
jgi:hypothetical protein